MNDMGAPSKLDRATRASTEPASSLGHSAGIPSAGLREPLVVSLRGVRYIHRNYVCHHVAGGEDVFEFAEEVFDETDFWGAVDRKGLGNVPSDPLAALQHMAAACEPHEVFWMQIADDGASIRRWSRTPFEGARKCRVEIAGEDPIKTAKSGNSGVSDMRQQPKSKPDEKSADPQLIYDALRFMFWAAGEGISPINTDDAPEPEEAFWQYGLRTDDEEWETVADRYAAAQGIEARRAETPSGSVHESPVTK